MILWSPPPLARTLPSDEKATVLTLPLPFSQTSGNTYVTVVYASPPLNLRLSPGERGRAAGKIVTLTVLPAMAQNKQVSGGDKKKKSLANLWPSSVFRRSPFFGSHRMILLSAPPLARSLPSKRQATDVTQWLPFSQMSGNTHVTAVYASPPLNLRLSPGEGGRHATLRKGGSPMSGESPLAGETRNFSQNAVTCGPRAS
jgi:hypothetical protein